MSSNAKKERPLSAMDRLIQQTMGEGRTLGGADDISPAKWPNLWAWLTRTDAGRDYMKQPATMRVSAGPDGFIASLSDNDLCVSLDAPSMTLEGVFDALEAALTSPAPAIRSWGKKQPQLRKRKQV